jgi:Fe-S-cluster-containing dehydrogenase component
VNSISRREFVKVAASALVATVALSASKATSREVGGRRWAMFIDVSKCYGCMACVVACAAENNVPVGVFKTWVERYVLPSGGVVFVPKLCNHCDNPPCVKACPTRATHQTEDGVVLVDPSKCIGCKSCIVACPYRVNFTNPLTGTADKCTFCYHRIKHGRLPACVEVCPTRARVFGDLNDPDSEVRKIIDRTPTMVWKPELRTEPRVYYYALPEVASR